MSTWSISEDVFDPQQLHSHETVYTSGNGYLGTRGAFEEGYPAAQPLTLVHGQGEVSCFYLCSFPFHASVIYLIFCD